MKTIIFGLLLAAFTVAQQTSTIETLTIHVNKTAVDDIKHDYKNFTKFYKKTMKKEMHKVKKAMADAYRTTTGKLILNFGKTITPAVEKWADLYKDMQVNDGCNQDCAVTCFNPRMSHHNFFFNTTCLHACGCTWDFELLSEAESNKTHDEFFNATHQAKHELKDRVNEFKSIVGPAIRDYMEKGRETHDEFASFIREHAVQDMGCDEQCVVGCTNPDEHFLFDLPRCLDTCDCRQNVVRLEFGEYNYPALMSYNNYDLKAWSLFKRLQ